MMHPIPALILSIALPLASHAHEGRQTSSPLPCADATYTVLHVERLASDTQIDGTRVGGISGIDHLGGDRWVLISDDRSEHGDARFYTASIPMDAHGGIRLQLLGAVPLRDKEGHPYPAPGGTGFSVDAEAVRVDPRDGTLWWTSEGDATAGAPPSIGVVDLRGYWQRDIPLPDVLIQRPALRSGPRTNLAFEGLAWDRTGTALWAALEAPLHQDGPLASMRGGALVRFSLLDRTGALLQQRVYSTDAVAPHAPHLRADNGVSEILGAEDGQLLVLERSGIERDTGGFAFTGKLYCTDTEAGSEVSAMESLAGQQVRAIPKRLVMDLGSVPGLPRANYEGMAWGPVLEDGRRTLVLVSDNNFDAREETVIVVVGVGAPSADS